MSMNFDEKMEAIAAQLQSINAALRGSADMHRLQLECLLRIANRRSKDPAQDARETINIIAGMAAEQMMDLGSDP